MVGDEEAKRGSHILKLVQDIAVKSKSRLKETTEIESSNKAFSLSLIMNSTDLILVDIT